MEHNPTVAPGRSTGRGPHQRLWVPACTCGWVDDTEHSSVKTAKEKAHGKHVKPKLEKEKGT